MKKSLARLSVAALLLGGALVPTVVTTADAAAAPVKYKNCAALTKKFPHGVKKDAKAVDRYKASGKAKSRKSLARVDAKAYAQNKHLDADKDGIACER